MVDNDIFLHGSLSRNGANIRHGSAKGGCNGDSGGVHMVFHVVLRRGEKKDIRICLSNGSEDAPNKRIRVKHFQIVYDSGESVRQDVLRHFLLHFLEPLQ